MKKQKKSPLKDKPLRSPGQSLDEKIQKIIDEDSASYILFPILIVGFTVYSWLLWFQIVKLPNPLLITIISILISIYCFFRVLKTRKRLKFLRLGRDGERAVGQTLNALRGKGYRVFHDLIGGEFNLDHVIVCEHGVFSIETKTYSKPKKGECKIIYSEEGISIDGYKSEKKILIQVEAQKKWLEKQIVLLTGIKITVKPVIVFPGWYIENQNKGSNVWVLEPKALPTFIGNSPKTLNEENVRLISNHISRYIRTTYD
ncbi:MAG: NERD domain-containing protein [Gammaproteobacteria bacterium]|nr:MAG: NERD domain-containing protein [Gammaproteobacteria bacterium]